MGTGSGLQLFLAPLLLVHVDCVHFEVGCWVLCHIIIFRKGEVLAVSDEVEVVGAGRRIVAEDEFVKVFLIKLLVFSVRGRVLFVAFAQSWALRFCRLRLPCFRTFYVWRNHRSFWKFFEHLSEATFQTSLFETLHHSKLFLKDISLSTGFLCCSSTWLRTNTQC